MGIYGGSYGGYSTLIGMTMFATAFDAGVSVVGMADLRTFLKNTAEYRRAAREAKYGRLDQDMDSLTALSPIVYLGKLKAPLQIQQGVNDPRVPVGEALLFHNTLQEKGVPSELILFGDEGHGAQKTSNIILQYGHMISFFKKHLLK